MPYPPTPTTSGPAGGEYSGSMDEAKTVERRPRPVTDSRDRARLINLTGDPSGTSPTDNKASWQGLVKSKYDALLADALQDDARYRQQDHQL